MKRQVSSLQSLAMAVCLGCIIIAGPAKSSTALFGLEPFVQVFRHDFRNGTSVSLEGYLPGPDTPILETEQGIATLPPSWHLIFPVSECHTARLTMEITLPPLVEDGDETESLFGCVLSNRHRRVVKLHRARKEGRTISHIQFADIVEDNVRPERSSQRLIREFAISRDLANGEWAVSYHHGLMLIEHAGEELWRSYLDGQTNVVTSIIWEQKQGPIVCRSMQLEIVPHSQHSEAERATLQEADQLNMKMLSLVQSEKLSDALVCAREVSGLYLSVLGEDHHDTASSFLNLASVLEKTGQYEEAQECYERALRTRREVLGATHPDTALVLLNLGTMMMRPGKYELAFPYFRKALPIVEKALGREASLVKSVNDTLRRLVPAIELEELYENAGHSSSRSREAVLAAIGLLRQAENPQLGTRNQKIKKALEAWNILRELADPPPELVGHAALVAGRMLEQEGRTREALLFYQYCVRWHEARIGVPRQDLSRALIFAQSLAESNRAKAGYGLRAIENQYQVLCRYEADEESFPEVLRAIRDETAAVYVQSAQRFIGFTDVVVALLTNAIKLSHMTGNDRVAHTASILLFNQFIIWTDTHRYPELLLSLNVFLENQDAAPSVIDRKRVSGMMLRYVRTARELRAMNPPREDLARRYVLRVVVLERICDLREPRYIGHYSRELIEEMDLTDDVGNLQLPSKSIWPTSAASVPAAELMERLDEIVAPVDLVTEFPKLHLSVDMFPPVIPDVNETMHRLGLDPLEFSVGADHLSLEVLDADIAACLGEDSDAD